MTMRLTSPAFASGQTIPSRFTCDGVNHSPPLRWEGAPGGTKSFALVCRDPDAPAGDWYHWALFNIPHQASGLDENRPPAGPDVAEGINDFRKPGYGGPCPPRGHGRHHYRFTLYALDVVRLDLPAGAPCRAVEAAAAEHALATAELVGLYER